MKHLILAILMCSSVFADEVILKDGRKIEWRSIEDAGENLYVIVTPEGGRITVKRSEVESFQKTEHASPLTGASVTFGKAKLDTIDLLKKIDSEKGYLAGDWKLLPDGTLQCTAPKTRSQATCQIQYTPASEEYNLTVVLERTDGDDHIEIAFPTPGGNQAQYFFDVLNGQFSSILVSGGPDGFQKASPFLSGKQILPKKPRTMVFMVRKTAFIMQLDGKDVCTFKADWSKIQAYQGPTAKDAFAIGALSSSIKVSKMVLTYPSAK